MSLFAKTIEELHCWQAARNLVVMVDDLIRMNPALSKNYNLKDQLFRASLSVMNNIAEGFGRYHKKEFMRFLDIAKASCVEVESMSYVLADLKLTVASESVELKKQITITKRKTAGLLAHLYRTNESQQTAKTAE